MAVTPPHFCLPPPTFFLGILCPFIPTSPFSSQSNIFFKSAACPVCSLPESLVSSQLTLTNVPPSSPTYSFPPRPWQTSLGDHVSLPSLLPPRIWLQLESDLSLLQKFTPKEPKMTHKMPTFYHLDSRKKPPGSDLICQKPLLPSIPTWGHSPLKLITPTTSCLPWKLLWLPGIFLTPEAIKWNLHEGSSACVMSK